MKVKFQYGIGSFSGTRDNGVFYMSKDQTFSIQRKWVLPKHTAQNTLIGSCAKNLAIIWQMCSALYKADWKTYAQLYYSQNPAQGIYDPNRSAYAWWTKAMWAWAKDEDPDIDLSSITFEDVETLGSHVKTVSACANNNFIPNVVGVDELTATL